jgi:hypothetical protein
MNMRNLTQRNLNRRNLNRRTRVGALGLVVALAAVGCGQSDLEQLAREQLGQGQLQVEATPRFLQSVADRTEAEGSLRFEIDMAVEASMGGADLSIDPAAPYATGAVADGRSQVLVDLGALLTSVMDQATGGEGIDGGDLLGLLGDDLTIETRSDGTLVFLRAPVLGLLGGLASSLGDAGSMGELGPLGELGDGWGVIDVERVGGPEAQAALGRITGAGSADPLQLTALLRAVEGDVDEVGRTELRGVSVTHLTGSVPLARLAEAQGTDLDALADDPAVADALDPLLTTLVPIDVFVDDDGRLHRIAFSFDLGPALAEAGASGGTASFRVAMDAFDHGDPAIAIELPDRSEAVDLTDWVLGFGVD